MVKPTLEPPEIASYDGASGTVKVVVHCLVLNVLQQGCPCFSHFSVLGLAKANQLGLKLFRPRSRQVCIPSNSILPAQVLHALRESFQATTGSGGIGERAHTVA